MCGVSVALIAGCSTLPSSGITQSRAFGDGVRSDFQLPPPQTSYKGMLKWFADGKMPGPAPRWFMKKWLHNFEHRKSFHQHSVRKDLGTVGLWALSSYDWLIGTPANGHRDVYAIDVYQNNCSIGGGMKVDGNGNAWVSCATWYNGSNAWGSAEEYSNTGALVGTYKGACPSNLSGCQSWYAYGDDVAPDGKGGVYVGDLTTTPCVYISGSFCTQEYGTGWEYFASPSAQPVYSNVMGNWPAGCSSNCINVNTVTNFDVDGSGNVWTVFDGCFYYYSGYCASGIAEVTGVSTGNPNLTVAVSPGVLPGSGPASIYIAGNTAMVTDTYNRTIYKYTLPITPSSTPTVYGVTNQSHVDECGAPNIGGFNASGSGFAVADFCGWVNAVAGGKSTFLSNVDFLGVTAAGFAPSNK
jgi:hypothetical protein